jgi:hypothetical protein
MITIQSAENALKNIYLETVINDINTKTNPFLTMVQNNAKTVSGKEARAAIRFDNEGSIKAGVEGGELPTSTGSVCEIVSPLKNLYGTFQISDKAVRASQNNAGAFASLLGAEMQNLVSTAQKKLNTMLYGNGKKFLGHTEMTNNVLYYFELSPRFAKNVKVGDVVDLYNANNDLIGAGLVVTDMLQSVNNPEDTRFKFTGTLSVANPKMDRMYVYSTSEDDGETELNGIDSVFRQDKIYNLDKATHKQIAPFIMTDDPTLVQQSILNESRIMDFFDGYENHCQGLPADILLVHPLVKKAVFENIKVLRTNVDVAELAGGFKGFSFNGLPVYSDVKCKFGTMYALNSDSWAMHQLCDWTWLSGDDGSVLKQIDGHAGYSATLVKYAELICDKPFIQGKITNYTGKRSV